MLSPEDYVVKVLVINYVFRISMFDQIKHFQNRN